MSLAQPGSAGAETVEVLGDELNHHWLTDGVGDVAIGEPLVPQLGDDTSPLHRGLAGGDVARKGLDEAVEGAEHGVFARRGLDSHFPDPMQQPLRPCRPCVPGYRRRMAPTAESTASRRTEFARLHDAGTFIMPNAWDTGSALVLQSLGFEAVATTSSGFAAALGRHDQSVTLAELSVHVADLCSALDIPVSVDAEAGYSEDRDGLARTVAQLAATGAAGVSIEDFLPRRGVVGLDEATERVAMFTNSAHEEGMVVTARAENHLYGVGDLDDTIRRLQAYREAGADVVYAPGLESTGDIARLVSEVDAPVNVLMLPDGPSIPEMSRLGVRRVSTGGALAFAAYGALAAAGRELLELGTCSFSSRSLTGEERIAAFGPDED